MTQEKIQCPGTPFFCLANQFALIGWGGTDPRRDFHAGAIRIADFRYHPAEPIGASGRSGSRLKSGKLLPI